MAQIDARNDPTWRPATNGARVRHWGLARFAGREWARDKRGNIRWFGSLAADRMA